MPMDGERERAIHFGALLCFQSICCFVFFFSFLLSISIKHFICSRQWFVFERNSSHSSRQRSQPISKEKQIARAHTKLIATSTTHKIVLVLKTNRCLVAVAAAVIATLSENDFVIDIISVNFSPANWKSYWPIIVHMDRFSGISTDFPSPKFILECIFAICSTENIYTFQINWIRTKSPNQLLCDSFYGICAHMFPLRIQTTQIHSHTHISHACLLNERNEDKKKTHWEYWRMSNNIWDSDREWHKANAEFILYIRFHAERRHIVNTHAELLNSLRSFLKHDKITNLFWLVASQWCVYIFSFLLISDAIIGSMSQLARKKIEPFAQLSVYVCADGRALARF